MNGSVARTFLLIASVFFGVCERLPAHQTPSFTLTASPSAFTVVQGQSANSTVAIVPSGGFNGAVTLTANTLPSGISVTANPDPFTSTSLGTVSADATATPGTYPIVVEGTSGTISTMLTVTVTVLSSSAPTFTIAASPAAVTAVQGQFAHQTMITLTPINGFSSGVTATIEGLPAGATAAFGAGSSSNSEILLIDTSTSTPVGSYPVTVVATGGGTVASTVVTLTVTAAPITAVPVNLSAVDNVYAIFNNGTAPTNGGFDGSGDAYSSTLTGSSITWNGITFGLGAPGTPSGTWGTTIPLPAGNYSSLQFLGSGAEGAQANQTLTVTYTDGTSTTSVQGFSDWCSTPQGYANEQVALAMAYRIAPSGSTQTDACKIYGYSLALNDQKTVKSVTLPNNRDVIVLAAALIPAVDFQLSVSPSSVSTTQGGIAGSTVTFASLNGFSGSVSLTASNLPAGVTATFEAGSTPTSAAITLQTSATTPPGVYPITITGTSGTLIHSVTLNLTVVAPPDFALTDWSSVEVQQGREDLSSVEVVPINGFTGTVTFGITGLPSGVTAAFTPASSTTGATLVLTAASNAATGTSVATITGTSGALVHSIGLTITVTKATSVTQVNLSSDFNVYGIFKPFVWVTNGGLDGDGYAYDAQLLGSSLKCAGLPFSFGPADSASATSQTTVSLPQGVYSTLAILGTGVNGNQTNQNFTVKYTDGTTQTFTQSLSDWGYVTKYNGQSVAGAMAFRITPFGLIEFGPWHVYEYSFALSPFKYVSSVTLPNNRSVVVLAVTLAP